MVTATASTSRTTPGTRRRRSTTTSSFRQFGYGLHGYTEEGDLDNIEYKGNTVFDNGALSSHGFDTNILLGGMKNADNPKITYNMTYSQGHLGANNLGYSAGCSNTTVTNNYFSNGTALKLVNCGIATMTRQHLLRLGRRLLNELLPEQHLLLRAGRRA